MSDSLSLALTHILWLGGSVCSGKTTISEALAAKHGLRVYHCDRHEAEHVARGRPDRHPTLAASPALDIDEAWLLPSPERLAATSGQFHRERFELIIEDLLAMPSDRPILAEGYGLLPECVVPVIAETRRALWLISRPDFLTAMRDKRGMTIPALTSDPARAHSQIIARDILMAAALRQSVTSRGLTFFDVDGSVSLAEMTALVARHFGLA